MEKYCKIVQCLVNMGIKLVAVDFDLTILSIHTHGCWPFTSKQLIQKVRPSFQKFLTLALNSGHFHIAVVTQSPQVSLVQEVLREALPTCDTNKIIYRGADGKWKEVKGVSKEGKQQHIASVLKQLKEEQKIRITSEQILLLDDDINNIETAKRNSIQALRIIDDGSLDELLQERPAVSGSYDGNKCTGMTRAVRRIKNMKLKSF